MSDILDKTHARICIECRHHKRVPSAQSSTGYADGCTRVLSAVTGECQMYTCEWMRTSGYCESEGKLFEPMDVPADIADAIKGKHVL